MVLNYEMFNAYSTYVNKFDTQILPRSLPQDLTKKLEVTSLSVYFLEPDSPAVSCGSPYIESFFILLSGFVS